MYPTPWAQLHQPKTLVFEEEEHSVTSEGEERAHKKEEQSVCLKITDTHEEEESKNWNTIFLTSEKVF